VLGIDPGLTRCGVGVVDVAPDRSGRLVHVGVIRSAPDMPLPERLATIAAGIRAVLAEPGAVSYNFTRKGVVLVPKAGTTEDDLMMLVLEAGAEDVNDAGDNFEVVTEASDLLPVRKALQEGGVDYESAEASFIPSMSIDLDAEGARKVFRLIDALEDSDDVQNVWANFDVSDDVMAQLDED
jgi:transcriptional/translational regulatory protein YebC/TACO1